MKINVKIYLNRILLSIIYGLLFLIIFFTLIGFATKKASLSNRYRKKDPTNISQLKKSSRNIKEYKEIKTLRALTKPDEKSSLATNIVITPWFSYEVTDVTSDDAKNSDGSTSVNRSASGDKIFADDTAFIEELSTRRISTQTIILNYFSQFTKQELLAKGEKQVKKELIEKINSQFIFGKIDAIYFDDYIFID